MHRGSRVLALCLFCVLSSCLNFKQERMKIDYYILEYDPPGSGSHESLPAVVRIEPFRVAPPYDTHRMIYGEGSFKRDAYVYHRWRVNPGDLITYYLRRDLRESGIFKGVLPQESRSPSTHVIEGSVEEFYERNQESDGEAVLAITITLMKSQEPDISKRIVFQRTYGSTKALGERSPQALAVAMSQSMAALSKEIIKDIYVALRDVR